MTESNFWEFRFVVLGVSACLAVATMAVILRNRLHQNLLMKYAFALACSQLIVALLGVLFGVGSVTFDIGSTLDSSTHEIKQDFRWLEILLKVQAVLFKSVEMICFFLTTMLTYVIYKALKNQARSPYQRQIVAGGIVLCFALMTALALLDGFGLCSIDDKIYFNSTCNKDKHRISFALLWAVPCTLMALTTMFMVVLIRKYAKPSISSTLRTEFQLVLIVYYIPCLGFVVYLFDVALTMHMILTEPYTQTGLFHVLFLMPIVTLATVCKYNRQFQKSMEGSELPQTSVSSQLEITLLQESIKAESVGYDTMLA